MVISGQPTRRVLRELRAEGFTPVRSRGSHSLWRHPSGTAIVVPDGHATISPGVYRQVRGAIASARSTEGER